MSDPFTAVLGELDMGPYGLVDERAAERGAIVSGIGRSGTGYVAEVLRRCGILARHEHVFRGGLTAAPCPRCLAALDVEVSGFAMPHLWEPRFRHVPVAMVVRHPLDWYRSWGVKRYARDYLRRHIELGPAHPNPDYAPFPGTIMAATEALATWVQWNVAVARRAMFFFRVEAMGPEHVAAIALLAGVEHDDLKDKAAMALAETPTSINTSGPMVMTDVEHDAEAPLTWASLPASPWRERARELARYFGYSAA